MAPGRPGHLVEPAGPQAWARVFQENWSKKRAIDQSTSRPGVLMDTVGLGEDCESLGRAGRHRGLSEPCARRMGQLVDTADHRTRDRVARD